MPFNKNHNQKVTKNLTRFFARLNKSITEFVASQGVHLTNINCCIKCCNLLYAVGTYWILSQKFPDKIKMEYNCLYTSKLYGGSHTQKSELATSVQSSHKARSFLDRKRNEIKHLRSKRNFLCIIIPLHAKASTDSQTTLIYKMKEMFKVSPVSASCVMTQNSM